MSWAQFYDLPRMHQAAGLHVGLAPQRCYDLLADEGPKTSREIADECSRRGEEMTRKQAASALHKLKRRGMVVLGAERVCTVSGRKRKTWRIFNAR